MPGAWLIRGKLASEDREDHEGQHTFAGPFFLSSMFFVVAVLTKALHSPSILPLFETTRENESSFVLRMKLGTDAHQLFPVLGRTRSGSELEAFEVTLPTAISPCFQPGCPEPGRLTRLGSGNPSISPEHIIRWAERSALLVFLSFVAHLLGRIEEFLSVAVCC